MDYGARRMEFGGEGDFTMIFWKVSKRQEALLANKFIFVPDPNIICARLHREVGSEARSKEHYKKGDNKCLT